MEPNEYLKLREEWIIFTKNIPKHSFINFDTYMQLKIYERLEDVERSAGSGRCNDTGMGGI